MLSSRASSRISYIIRAAIYIIVGVSFSFTEYIWQARWTSACERDDLFSDSALTTRQFYTGLTTLDWRKPQNLNVTVVTFREDRESKEIFERCNRREALAELLDDLRAYAPRAIVLDYYFSNHYCDQNEHLRRAIVDASKAGIAVIIGKHTINQAELEHLLDRRLNPEESKSFSRACLVFHNNLDLQLSNTPHVSYALLRLNDNYRKLPLSWNVFPAPGNISPQDSTERMETIAVAAAHTVKNFELPALANHPYTGFLPKNKILTIPGIALLCKHRLAGSPALNRCTENAPDLTGAIQHRIIMIGDDVDSDLHETTEGLMPGVFIFANHIESLLSGHFFRPLNTTLQVILGILWFILIEIIYIQTKNPLTGFAASILGIAILWMICVLIALVTGVLPVIWVPAAIALFLRFGEALREYIMARDRGNEPVKQLSKAAHGNL